MRRCLLVAVAFLLACLPALADNWPQWRGPTGDGISKEMNLPAEWSDTKNVVWKLKMPGIGSSTPAVWGDRLFVTSQDGDDLVLLCISTKGEELWKKKLANATRSRIGPRGDEGNGASGSPSTDGKHVYAIFGTGDFACFDFDGKEIWQFNIQDRYGAIRMQWGWHTTPLLDGDRLYLALLHSGGNWVIAFNKADGKEVWKITRESDGVGECKEVYASPCIWRNGNDAVLITHGNDYTIGHSLEDGKELWRVGDLNSPTNPNKRTFRFVASPTVAPDLIVIPTAKNGPVVGLKPGASGKVLSGSKFEQWRKGSNTPDVPSPLIHDGLVYLCRETGRLSCLDAKTGAYYYDGELLHSDRHRASPVYGDGKIYAVARDGTTSVVKVGKKFEKIASNKLPDTINATPAISGGRIYLRGWKDLYCIGVEAK
jgi:outer membrane protein assembly factor BamB